MRVEYAVEPTGRMAESLIDNGADLVFDQFLSFSLGGKQFALDILLMQEIRRGNVITEVPNMPPQVSGVINLRGLIVPVIDLRKLLGITAEPPRKKPSIVVTKTIRQNQERIVGLMVDAVIDVNRLFDGDIQKLPEIGNEIDREFVEGVVRINDNAVVCLSAERCIDSIHELKEKITNSFDKKEF